MSESEREARGYFTEVYTWRLLPEVQTFIISCTISGTHGLLTILFQQKRYSFRIPSFDRWYPFYTDLV